MVLRLLAISLIAATIVGCSSDDSLSQEDRADLYVQCLVNQVDRYSPDQCGDEWIDETLDDLERIKCDDPHKAIMLVANGQYRVSELIDNPVCN